jgi:hypothetical protein
MRKKKLNRPLKLVMLGIPLVAAMGASLLPIQRMGHQFLVLTILVWVQVFFLVECFLMNK